MACFNKSSLSFSPAKTVKIIGSELNTDHTDYVVKVTVGSFEWKVYRRYSEFLKLNDTLPTEVRDVAKQLLPKKHFFGNNSESVVKDRQGKLEIYLQCLLRSLPIMPQALLQFLKFDVYEIHGITESLAEHLYKKGDVIIKKNKAFGLSVVQLHAICQRMELPEPTSSGDPTRDIGHLLDFINQLKTLKVIGNQEKFGLSDIQPNDFPVHFQHFKSLHSLSFDNCNFERISINSHLRKNLRKLRVANSLSYISEVLLAGIHWENQCNFPANVLNELSWSSLEGADFSSNKIHSMDPSLSLLPKLTTLNLSHNSLEKVEFVEELPSLKHLDLSHNKLDCSSLANLQLTTITTLNISHNRIKSFTALMGLMSLSVLDACFNEVEMAEELRCLGRLHSLTEVKLRGNSISLKPGYRLVVLEMFGDHFHRVTLDDEKISEKEKDAIMVRLAIQAANENSSKSQAWKNFQEGGSSKQTASEALQHSCEAPSTNCSSSRDFKACSSASSPNLGFIEVATVTRSVPDDKNAELDEMVSDENVSNLNSSLEKCPLEISFPDLESSFHQIGDCLEASGGDKPTVGEVMEKLSLVRDGDIPSSAALSKTEELARKDGCRGSDLLTANNFSNPSNQTFSFGLQKLENNFKSTSLKHSRRRKYFLLPETLPNHNNRSLMSLLEDIMDPPDSFGLPEVEYRQNNVGHVMWCSALTNLRKSSHTQERPVCVCVTPFKIHIFKVDQLRGDAGVPKLRYFTFVLISDIYCFMIGCRHLCVRIVDRFHPSHVIVLLTFNRIKTENFLEHVKKASRRNIPFLDDYEDPVIINSSLHCEQHLAEFLNNFESDFEAGLVQEVQGSRKLLQCYQLAQLNSEAEFSCNVRTSAVIFNRGFFYILFQDFAHFPKSSNNILEFIPSRSAQHRVAAIFPLTCNLLRIKQYDTETIEGLEGASEVPDFIGYGLELHFSIRQQVQVLNLRWPTSCMRREFMVHLHEAFASKHPPSLHDLHFKLENLLKGDDKSSHRYLSIDKHSFQRSYIVDDEMFRSNLSC